LETGYRGCLALGCGAKGFNGTLTLIGGSTKDRHTHETQPDLQFEIMSRHKLRVHKTPVDNLVANLRGEVGEIITTWTMMSHLRGICLLARSSVSA
jgi:hypothetical protein